ncbi:MucBP domain-containing protein, partial [Lacticaseibacillus baoqingensis]
MGKKQIRIGTQKTRFRMYKAKHQWVIAGATVITMAALGFAKPQVAKAAAPTPDEQEAVTDVAPTTNSTTLKTITRTIHYVDATGQTIAPATVQTAHFASNDAGKTWQQTDDQAGFAAISLTSINGLTPDSAQVPAAAVTADTTNSDVTVHYSSAAPAPTSTTQTTPTPATPAPAAALTNDTTTPVSDSTADTTGKTASANDTTATQATPTSTTQAAPAAKQVPIVGYKSLHGTATMTVNKQTSIEESYSRLTGSSITKPDTGTKDKDTLSIAAANLVKGDTLVITLPNFKAFDSTPNLTGATKAQQGNVVTYTVTADSLTTVGFDMQIKAANWPDKTKLVYQDNATVAVDGNITGQVAMKATYRLADFGDYKLLKQSNTGDYAGTSGLHSNVQVGDDFVRGVDISYEYGLTTADYKHLTITVPVPATYQLDEALTQQFNIPRTPSFNYGDDQNSVWQVTQAAVGAPVVMTLDMAASPATARIDRAVYFAGKFVSGDGLQTASAPASVDGATLYGDIKGTFDTFKETIVSGTPVDYQLNDVVTNYVGPTDVGTYNVMDSSWLLMNVTKATKDPVNVTFKVPANMIGTGVKIASNSAADAIYGLAATLTAYDASGTVVGTTALSSLARDSSGNYVWVPETNATIASFTVNFTSLPNTSYSQIKLAPILAVATAPNGTQTYTIPTTSEIGTTVKNILNYQVNVTDSHAIVKGTPHLDAPNINIYQAGGTLNAAFGGGAFGFYPFDNGNQTTYVILDQASVYFIPLLDHATFVSIDKFADNATEVTVNGHRYLRIDVPAGYGVNTSKNGKYNTNPTLSPIKINMIANADVTPDTQIKMGDATQEPVFMGISDGNIDEATWQAYGGRIWTLDEVRAAGYGDIADSLAAAGFTKAYLDRTARQGNLSSGKGYPITAPTELMLSTGVKADSEDTYVSGDDQTASFYPDADELTGTIREYIYNGGTNNQLDYHGLITLPKKADGDAYSLALTGPITVPAGVSVQYSTQKITGTAGQALSDAQLATFADGSTISDWTTVKSVLFIVPTLANKGSVNVEMPIKVMDNSSDAATAQATAFNYTKAQDGMILGAQTTALNTRVAPSQRVITIKYQDIDENTLAADRTVKADAGTHLTIKPLMITGYKTPVADIDYTVTPVAAQTVIFTYVQTKMNVTVNFINVLTGTAAKGPVQLTGYIGDPLPLTEDTYTQITGYTAMPDNAKAYTISTAQVQNINLYFTPQSMPFTVNFVEDSNHAHVLAPAQTLTGIVGYQYPVVAATVSGYTPTKASDNLTLTATQNQYTFYYKADPQTLTLKFVDTNDQPLHADMTVNTTTNAKPDLKAVVNTVTIPGYTRQTPDDALNVTTTVDSKGKLVNPVIKVVYQAAPITIKVHYVDNLSGQDIVTPDEITKNYGEAFTATAKTYTPGAPENMRFAGYTLMDTDPSVSGTMAEDTADITFHYQANVQVGETDKTALVVDYVDAATGTSLQDAHTDSGKPGETFTVTAPTFDGYSLSGNETVTDTYQGSLMHITFNYLPTQMTQKSTLTVHYINAVTGEKMQADKVTTGAQGTAFTETAPAMFAGYWLQGDSTVSGTYQGSAMSLTFNYLPAGEVVDDAATPATLTVHYVNVVTGDPIQADKVTTGDQGTAFTETAPTIAGYRLQGDSSVSGTYVGNEKTLTFSYLPDGQVVDDTATPATLTVHYVNVVTGDPIQADKVTTGDQGTAFTETAPAIAGYRLQGDSSVSGTYVGNEKTLTFSYLPDGQVVDDTEIPTTLTVHYVNVLTGDPIQADKVTTGAQGTAFTETAPTIAGYRIQGEDTASGTYVGNEKTLTFSYLPDGQVVDDTATPTTLTVHYVNAVTGDSIQADKVTTGAQGTAFTETAPAIAGYRLQGDSSVSGTYV